MKRDLEFYATPAAFSRWLFVHMAHRGRPIVGTIFEPCVGDGAIPRAVGLRPKEFGVDNRWITNDLDPHWAADDHRDARFTSAWTLGQTIDWTVSNPPFTPALEIIEQAIAYSRVGVAMHLRASIHEVLKTGKRRTWMREHVPTGILWLPRFAYQRSPTTGKWTTDSVCACWVIWLKNAPNIRPAQFIDYAPESVMDALDAETPAYRSRMDELMGLTGVEPARQRQAIAAQAQDVSA